MSSASPVPLESGGPRRRADAMMKGFAKSTHGGTVRRGSESPLVRAAAAFLAMPGSTLPRHCCCCRAALSDIHSQSGGAVPGFSDRRPNLLVAADPFLGIFHSVPVTRHHQSDTPWRPRGGGLPWPRAAPGRVGPLAWRSSRLSLTPSSVTRALVSTGLSLFIRGLLRTGAANRRRGEPVFTTWLAGRGRKPMTVVRPASPMLWRCIDA